MKKLIFLSFFLVSTSGPALADGARLLSIHDAMIVYHMGNIGMLRDYAKKGQEFSNADVALGVYYAERKKDYKKFIKYEKIASAEGNPYADGYLGSYYYAGLGKNEEDCIKAKKYFLRGLEINGNKIYRTLNLKMAEFYYDGCDGVKNYKKSIFWLKKLGPSVNKVLEKAYDKIGETGKAEKAIRSNRKADVDNAYTMAEMSQMSPYSVTGKQFMVDFSDVQQVLGRKMFLMNVYGEHFVGIFGKYGYPAKGDFVSGYAVGVGAFKYENVFKELKIVPELKFEKYKVLSFLNPSDRAIIAKKEKEQVLDVN